ncbi:MAG: RHS repeat-associated core domain-containing protein [Desulfuromonadaceae bacterium]|nr:RHS repeat-associated core domain-containing protein [Desulfuromonadaceae bacterium]
MSVLRIFFCSSILLLAFCTNGLAVSCSIGTGVSTIGLEYVPQSCPPYEDNKAIYFTNNALTCSGGKVALLAPYGNTLNSPAAIAAYGASQNYRVMWNKDNGHIVLVSRYYTGKIDGVSMTSVPAGTINTTGFEEIFLPNRFPDTDGNGNPDCADVIAPEIEKEPEQASGGCQPSNKDFASQVNIASGNLSLVQPLFTQAQTGLPAGIYFTWNSQDKRWHLNLDTRREQTWIPTTGVPYTCIKSIPHWVAISERIENGVVYPVKWIEIEPDPSPDSCTSEGTDIPYIRILQGDGGYLYFSGTIDGSSDLASVNGNYATWLAEDNSVAYRNGTLLNFNEEGRILERNDRNGRVALYTYADNELQHVEDRFGRATLFTHDAAGHITGITAPDGRSVSLSYTGELLTQVTTSDARSWSYTYNEAGELAQAIDPAGNIKTYTYAGDGRVVQGTTADGTRSISYNDAAHESVITNRDGSQTIHGYDAIQQTPIYTIDPQGGETSYTYNNRNRLLATSDQELRTRTYTYNALGDLATETDAAGITTTYTYNNSGDVIAITDAAGHTTQIAYDANGNPISTTLPNGLQIINTYNSLGQLISRRNVNSAVTSYAYDSYGFPAQVTAPNGSVTSYSFDIGGRLNQQTDASGHTTSYSYDNAGRLANKTTPGGDTTSYTYNVMGQLTHVLHPDSTTTALTYDHAGRLRSLTDGAGRSVHYQYNSLGQITSSTDGNSNNTDYTSNFMDQTTRITDPLGAVTALVYQDDGLSLAQINDGRGNSLIYSYDTAGRLIQTNQHGVITTYTYNGLGQLATRTDARGVVTEYSYDNLGRLTQVHFPTDSSQDIIYTYDTGIWGGGHLTSMQDASGSHSYSYDSSGRLLNHSHSLQGTAYTTGYTYDASGNLVTLSYPGGLNVTTTYDSDRRPLNIQAALGDQTLDILTQISYDSNARPVQWQHGNGLFTSAGYDNGGLLQSLSVSAYLLEDYTRDGAGQLTSLLRTLPSIGQDSFQYDNVGQLLDADKNNAIRHYSYDAVGNRLSLEHDGDSDSYTLDTQSNQLLAISGYNPESRFYDAQGNTLQLSTSDFDALQLSYAQSGQLQSIDNGNVLTDYLYDGNNLRVVKQGYNATIHYHYDNQGRLLAESSSDGTVDRAVVWFGNTPIALLDIEQTDPTIYTCSATESLSGATGPDVTIDTAAHSITVHTGDYAGIYAISAADWIEYDEWISFTWSNASFRFEGGFYPDLTLPERSGGLVFYRDDIEGNPQIADIYKLWKESESGGSSMATPYHLHLDQIGAPVLLTDANGAAVWAADYAPFGQATVNDDVDGDSNKVTCNLRFPGQYFDAESGLHYNWHRYYEPKSGRYITLDPLGIGGGDVNLYRYVGNNPLNWVDPKGLLSEIVVWQPVGWGQSSFGHVSTNINGTTYSYGQKGMTILLTSEYLGRNSFREGIGSVLSLTSDQEARLQACMNGNQDDYSSTSNNCGSPIQGCLNKLGFNFSNLFPVSLGKDLIDSGLVNQFNFYPAITPANGSSAPWTK